MANLPRNTHSERLQSRPTCLQRVDLVRDYASGLSRLTHNHGFISSYQGLQWSPDSGKILYGLETLMLSDISELPAFLAPHLGA